jgi:hypothetical protein
MTFVVAIILVVLPLILVLSSQRAWKHAGKYSSPSLEAVSLYTARGDLAFDGRSYEEAADWYAVSLDLLRELMELDAPQESASEGSPSYEYLQASVEAKLRLAELGTKIRNDGTHDIRLDIETPNRRLQRTATPPLRR